MNGEFPILFGKPSGNPPAGTAYFYITPDGIYNIKLPSGNIIKPVDIGYATATGTDTYSLTIPAKIKSYVTGQRFSVIFTNGNTGAATININSLGAKAIKKNVNQALAAGDIPAGKYVDIGYDGTNFQLLGSSSIDLSNLSKSGVGIVIDGQGGVIATGGYGPVISHKAGTITGWTILEISDTPNSGSIVVDVWKDTYANFPPTVADTIAGTEKPTLSTQTKNQDLTLTTWTTSVAAGDMFKFKVESATGVYKILIIIHITAS